MMSLPETDIDVSRHLSSATFEFNHNNDAASEEKASQLLTEAAAADDGRQVNGSLSSKSDRKSCRVCGDVATGMYFGALVCVPCKTFFLRYAGDSFSYVCKQARNCEITIATRTQCKYCRYEKCLRVGMCRRVRPSQVQVVEGQHLCVVCQDVANGIHFGMSTCEGCKKFFRRGLTEHKQYRCRNVQNCSINPSNRNACRFCRYKKCIDTGMSRDAIQMGRPSKMNSSENSSNKRKPAEKSVELDYVSFRRFDPEVASSFSNLQRSTFESGVRTGLLRCPVSVSSYDGNRIKQQVSSCFSDAGIMLQSNNSLPWVSYEDLTDSRCPVNMSLKRSRLSGSNATAEAGGDVRQGDVISDVMTTTFPDSTMTHEDMMETFLCLDYTATADGSSSSSSNRLPTTNYTWNRKMNNNNWSESSTCPLTNPAAVYQDEGGDNLLLPCKEEVEEFDCSKVSQFKENGRNGDVNQTKQTIDAMKEEFPGFVDGDVTSSECFSGFENTDCFSDVLGPEMTTQHESMLCSIPRFHDNPSDSCFPASASASVALKREADLRIGSPSISSSSNKASSGLSCPCSKANERERGFKEKSSSGCCYGNYEKMLNGDDSNSMQSEEVPMEENSSSSEEQYWQIVNRIIPAYTQFITMGTKINRKLKEDYETWKRSESQSMNANKLSAWIGTNVVPAFTTLSVNYCKNLPGFSNLNSSDQKTLIALGQSQSRILVAALHWYDVERKNFRHFLSWRSSDDVVGDKTSSSNSHIDLFKRKLIEFAEKITILELDPIEAALLNVLTIISTDYPALVDKPAIKHSRSNITSTLQAYISANHDKPCVRMKSLFECLSEAKELGLLHYAMTNTRTLTAEEVEKIGEGNYD